MRRNVKKFLGTLIIASIAMSSSVYADDNMLIFENTVKEDIAQNEEKSNDEVNISINDVQKTENQNTTVKNKSNTVENKPIETTVPVNTNITPKTDTTVKQKETVVNIDNKATTTTDTSQSAVNTTNNTQKVVSQKKNMTNEEKNAENKKFSLFENVENSYVAVRLASQSKEELKSLYDRGFRVFEITVSTTRDNQVVLADNFGEYFKRYYGKAINKPSIDEYFSYKMSNGNTQMSLGDINVFLNNHPDARFFVKTLEPSRASMSIIKNKSIKNKDKLIPEINDFLADYKKVNSIAMVDLKGKGSIESYISMNKNKNIVFLYQNTVPSMDEIEAIKNAGYVVYETKKYTNDKNSNGVIYSIEDAIPFTMNIPEKVYAKKYSRPQIKNDRFIAHAGSRYAGVNMSNSWQAMKSAYDRGARLIEIDFDWTTDGKPVQVHDWASFSKFITEEYTGVEGYYMTYEKFKTKNMIYRLKQMSIDDTVDFLKENDEAYIVTDVKEDNMQNSNEKILKIFQEAGEDIESRIIPQIYSTDEYEHLSSMGFKNIIYTLYRTEQSPYNVLEFAKLNDLYAVTMDNSVRIYTKLPKLLSDNGIRVYTHTENSKSRAKSFILSGKAYGIYSDDLLNDEDLK